MSGQRSRGCECDACRMVQRWQRIRARSVQRGETANRRGGISPRVLFGWYAATPERFALLGCLRPW
jgi:hypothetical protein